MTPREILEKYGLKTDVKSVKERIGIERNDECGYWESSKQYAELNNLLFFGNIIDECFQADLDLLCEMAERAEKVDNILYLYRKLNDLLELYYTSDSLCEKIGLVGRISDLRDEISEFEEELK